MERHIYDFVRQPRILPSETDEVVVIFPRTLRAELTCPICLDILKETVRSKECLHRFCKECIGRALRTGNRECPTCRAKLPSKRSLVPDPTYDSIINIISESCQQSAAQLDAPEGESNASEPTCSSRLSGSTLIPTESPEDQILFHLLPYPGMLLSKFSANASRILVRPHFVRACSVTCTIAHLKKFLMMRAAVDLLTKADDETSKNAEQLIRQNIQEITICARAGNELISLNSLDSMNILTVFSRFRSSGLTFPLQFYYYYHEVGTSGRSRPPSPLEVMGLGFK
ncbi:zf-RING 2 domain containing protein [Trichuris trichiura]|uniref:RING-type E3 ubiquitin transferase n=1 Tax=Trichuris trichiura TaxID=36087 RepID=A0A077ZKQ0_TRITR|nr:zf-RING 2 domain containing protein [Trichuris trichiura]